MRVVVAGGTGFVGRALCARLRLAGHEPVVLSRTPGDGRVVWDGRSPGPWTAVFKGADAVVNLAGENIAEGRWNKARKAALVESRLQATRALVSALAQDAVPRVLINASAVGFYGGRGDELLDEGSPPGKDFLASLCVDWEAQARKAEALGVRVVRLRIGVVLGQGGGALAKMLPPFRLGAGGPLGSGGQWISWIALDDLASLILDLLKSKASGAVNATAPNPVTNRDFARALGRALGRPAAAKVPAFVLRLALGEMADVLLEGQRVLPKKALADGFSFAQPDIDSALQSCLTATNP